MRASVSNFRGALLLAVLLTASVAAAETRQAGSIPAPRPLDRREHCGYESWERLLPTHVKAQYAGGMGFLSAGYGWDYGRKCRWETDMMIGVLPKAYSDRTHMTFTLKQNYIPWSIRCGERFFHNRLSGPLEKRMQIRCHPVPGRRAGSRPVCLRTEPAER